MNRTLRSYYNRLACSWYRRAGGQVLRDVINQLHVILRYRQRQPQREREREGGEIINIGHSTAQRLITVCMSRAALFLSGRLRRWRTIHNGSSDRWSVSDNRKITGTDTATPRSMVMMDRARAVKNRPSAFSSSSSAAAAAAAAAGVNGTSEWCIRQHARS